ncbi:50S ribosomal protein L25 [mine drainage metagenome]|uniref:50S ribosomal protein L25 n=1 Tax=mine drainage metagenome TaxID=410659 RepID=A0A1J5RZS8_9ZZZZ
MADKVSFKVGATNLRGKRAAFTPHPNRLVSAVIGNRQKLQALHMEKRIFIKRLKSDHSSNPVVIISERTPPKKVAFNPATDLRERIRYLRVLLDTKVHACVPIKFIDDELSPGLSSGGELNVIRSEVELLVDASAIPSELVVSLANANVDDIIKLSSVNLPEHARPVESDDVPLAVIKIPKGGDPASLGEEIDVRTQPHVSYQNSQSLDVRPLDPDAMNEVNVVQKSIDEDAFEDLILGVASDVVRIRCQNLLGKPSDHIKYILKCVSSATERNGV